MDAREFISARLGAYGLLGTNNAPPPARAAAFDAAEGFDFVGVRDGFRFGYDERLGGPRSDPGARFWTEYRTKDECKPFGDELLSCVEEIYSREARLYVNTRGSYLSAMFAEAAKRKGIPLRFVRPYFAEREHPLDEGDSHPIAMTFESFEQFADQFESVTHCTDAAIVLDAYISSFCDGAYIFDTYEVRIEDNNFDEKATKCVGPASWCVLDNEKFATLYTWLARERRSGVPSFLRWSPEIFSSYIGDPRQIDWLMSCSSSRAANGRKHRNNLEARLQIARAVVSGAPRMTSLKTYPESIVARMAEISRTLRLRNPGCASQHRSPLDRLLPRRLAPAFDGDSRLYGDADD